MDILKKDILKQSVLKTLLYYDIFSHPLNGDEIFTFLPQNTITKAEIHTFLKETVGNGAEFDEKSGYYYIKPNESYVNRRIEKENYSKSMWRAAWVATHVIKRFPFVRCVMVTGTLSKNSSDHTSDLDFMIITAPKRLWVAKSLLMLFKKIFLFNSKKYFCINYCITEDSLEISERNIFTATEIATIKATYNENMMRKFVEANKWIKNTFPNYILNDESLHTAGLKVSGRQSMIQKIAEIFFSGKFGDNMDEWLMQRTIKHWLRKFPHFNESERSHRLRSTPTESKAHPGSVQGKILSLYKEKLSKYNIS